MTTKPEDKISAAPPPPVYVVKDEAELEERVARSLCENLSMCMRRGTQPDKVCVSETGKSLPCQASENELCLSGHMSAARAAIAVVQSHQSRA